MCITNENMLCKIYYCVVCAGKQSMGKYVKITNENSGLVNEKIILKNIVYLSK